MLQDLDDAQIEDFLARWHRGASEEARQGDTKRELLARAIVDSAAIRQLAGNPLLLTMMAIAEFLCGCSVDDSAKSHSSLRKHDDRGVHSASSPPRHSTLPGQPEFVSGGRPSDA